MVRFVFLFVLLLASCFNPPAKNQDALRIGSTLPPTTLDPAKSIDFASATTLALLYDGLTKQGELAIADSIEISSDGLTYTFKLKEALWSDGSFVTAQDFVYAWKRALHTPGGSLFLFYPIKNGEKIANRSLEIDALGVRAVDDKTLVVELEMPTPYFQSIVSLPPYLPMKMGQENVFNGPYVFASSDLHSATLCFKKNRLYWNLLEHSPEEIQIHIIPDEQTALHLFEQGELDWIGGSLSSIPLDALEKHADAIILKETGASTFCCFNTQVEPLSNPAVRKALSSAIDRTEIVDFLFSSKHIVAERPIPPVLLYRERLKDREMPRRRPEFESGCEDMRKSGGLSQCKAGERKRTGPQGAAAEAAKLKKFSDAGGSQSLWLPDAGRTDSSITSGIGKKNPSLFSPHAQIESLDEAIPTLTLDIRSNAASKLLAQTLQSQWKETLGIDVVIVQSDAKTHLEKLISGKYQIALANWISFYDDPINLLERFQSASCGKNYPKWESAKYQELLLAAKMEIDLEKRIELYEQLEEILAEECPIAPIYHWQSQMLVQERVKDLEISSCGAAIFEQCTLTR